MASFNFSNVAYGNRSCGLVYLWFKVSLWRLKTIISKTRILSPVGLRDSKLITFLYMPMTDNCLAPFFNRTTSLHWTIRSVLLLLEISGVLVFFQRVTHCWPNCRRLGFNQDLLLEVFTFTDITRSSPLSLKCRGAIYLLSAAIYWPIEFELHLQKWSTGVRSFSKTIGCPRNAVSSYLWLG